MTLCASSGTLDAAGLAAAAGCGAPVAATDGAAGAGAVEAACDVVAGLCANAGAIAIAVMSAIVIAIAPTRLIFGDSFKDVIAGKASFHTTYCGRGKANHYGWVRSAKFEIRTGHLPRAGQVRPGERVRPSGERVRIARNSVAGCALADQAGKFIPESRACGASEPQIVPKKLLTGARVLRVNSAPLSVSYYWVQGSPLPKEA